MGERRLTDRQTGRKTRETERQADKDSIESIETVKQATEKHRVRQTERQTRKEM